MNRGLAPALRALLVVTAGLEPALGARPAQANGAYPDSLSILAPAAQSIFEGELNSIESAIEHLAPYELAGGALGLIAGLVIAFLIRSILFEFLLEAAMLCLMGGSFGLFFVFILSQVLTRGFDFPMFISIPLI